MQPAQPTPLTSFFDQFSSSKRQHSPNIWAPRAVPTNTTWPRYLDLSANYLVDRDIDQPRPILTLDPLLANPRANEDVFGPVGFPTSTRNRSVGVVGDGRKNSVPLHEDRVGFPLISASNRMLTLSPQNVEQMLRFLNLNSPVFSPTQPLPSLSSTTNNTPNLSPVSATSTLMTPTDLSPGFDKMNFQFEFDQSVPQTQSLLLDTSPPRLHGPNLSPTRKSFCVDSYGGVRGYNAINLPYVDPLSNRTSSTYLPQNLAQCPDTARPILPPWNGPHMIGGNDWLRAEDKAPEDAPFAVGTRTLNIPHFSAVHPTAHAHEVGSLVLVSMLPCF